MFVRDGINPLIDYAEASRLREAVAHLMIENPAYTPIFERLDRMAEDLKRGRSTADRARRIVERKRDLETLI